MCACVRAYKKSDCKYTMWKHYLCWSGHVHPWCHMLWWMMKWCLIVIFVLLVNDSSVIYEHATVKQIYSHLCTFNEKKRACLYRAETNQWKPLSVILWLFILQNYEIIDFLSEFCWFYLHLLVFKRWNMKSHLQSILLLHCICNLKHEM